RAVQPARFGGASGYVQFISPQGLVRVPGGQGSTPQIAPSASDRAIASTGRGRALSDRTVRGTHLRVLTVGSGGLGAVLIARPLTEVDRELSRIVLILVLVGIGGIDRRPAGHPGRAHGAHADRSLHAAHGDAERQPGHLT